MTTRLFAIHTTATHLVAGEGGEAVVLDHM